MVINEYIKEMFEGWGIKLSPSQILSFGFDEKQEFDKSKIHIINVAIVKYIPFLLLSPSSIKESEFSISWNKDAVKEFYKLMIKRYNLPDELGVTKKITFL